MKKLSKTNNTPLPFNPVFVKRKNRSRRVKRFNRFNKFNKFSLTKTKELY